MVTALIRPTPLFHILFPVPAYFCRYESSSTC